MKRLLLVLSCLVIAASMSSATLFTTANPIGQGKIAVLGGYNTDSNLIQSGTLEFPGTTYQGYIGYGLTDKLDIFGLVGQTTLGNLPYTPIPLYTINSYTFSLIGLALKYQILDEFAGAPCSASVGYSTRPIRVSASTTAGDGTVDSNLSLIGIGLSKIIVPFAPYAGYSYQKVNTLGSETGTVTELTVGTAIAWSEQGAVFVEYTSQGTRGTGSATTVMNTQLGLGVGYTL